MTASPKPSAGHPVAAVPSVARTVLPIVACWIAAIVSAGQVVFLTRECFVNKRSLAGQALLLAVILASIAMSYLLFSSGRLFMTQTQLAGGQGRLSRRRFGVIVLALYAPFVWVVNGGWIGTWPVLPGLLAGMFFKNYGYGGVVSGVNTILLLMSLQLIGMRFRSGVLLSVVGALVISSLTSYFAYHAFRW
ncbi:MAG: hypothetical protein H8E66_06355 [Planctomycetes bacterium]|nr:hypothetical protein [Planctomycetota bacterium]